MDLSNLSDEQRAQIEEKLKNMSPEELEALQSQQSIFRQIVAGKIPSKKVYSDDKCMAILDIKPASKGHMMILSMEHYAIMPQVPDEELGHLLTVSRRLSLAALKGVRASGSTFLVANGAAAGQRVQDFLIHIIPRREGDGLFTGSRQLVALDKRRALRGLIAAQISSMTGLDDPMPEVEGVHENGGSVEVQEESVESEDAVEVKESSESGEEADDTEGTDVAESDDDDSDEAEETEESESVPERSGASKNVDLDDIASMFK